MSAKKIIGILGAVGSGKSTVAKLLGEMGCGVIDADRAAHEALKMPEVKRELQSHFGADIFDNEGNVDRGKLGRLVFADRKNVETTNSIIHPQVMHKVESEVAHYQADNQVKAIVLDIPLLMEVGWADRCDALIFVECDEKTRHQRTHMRHGGRDIEAKKREKFQISLDKKAKIADYKVVNNSDLSALTDQVRRVFTGIITE